LLRLSHKKEIDVREYLFTDKEIEDDWNRYQEIMDLKKVLRPNNIVGSGINQGELLKTNTLIAGKIDGEFKFKEVIIM
jgi:hypothetical protein